MTGTPTPADTAHLATVAGDASATSPEAPDHGGTRDGPPAGPSQPVGSQRHGGQAERTLGAALPVLLAAGVFAVAFAHVHDVARWAGQPDWASWLIAVSVELMALASIIEIRHRRRTGAGVVWPVITLLAGIGMSGAANLAAAGPDALTGDPGPWVPVMALWPVAAFGLVAGLKATRPTGKTPSGTGNRDIPDPAGTPRHDSRGTPGGVRPTGDADRADRPAVITDQSDRSPRPCGPDTAPAALPTDLVATAREVAADLTRQGHPLTRTALARGVRARGQRCSTDRATLLLAAVRPTADGGTPQAQSSPGGNRPTPAAPGPVGITSGTPDG